MAQRLLKAEISRVGDEKSCVVMSQNILLGEEFSNQHVVRFSFHLIRFPFHQHFLLQLTQGGEQGLLLVLGDLQTSLVRGQRSTNQSTVSRWISANESTPLWLISAGLTWDPCRTLPKERRTTPSVAESMNCCRSSGRALASLHCMRPQKTKN